MLQYTTVCVLLYGIGEQERANCHINSSNFPLVVGLDFLLVMDE
jgi:hypothetical protein